MSKIIIQYYRALLFLSYYIRKILAYIYNKIEVRPPTTIVWLKIDVNRSLYFDPPKEEYDLPDWYHKIHTIIWWYWDMKPRQYKSYTKKWYIKDKLFTLSRKNETQTHNTPTISDPS